MDMEQVVAQENTINQKLLSALKAAVHMLERDYIDDSKMRVIRMCQDVIDDVTPISEEED